MPTTGGNSTDISNFFKNVTGDQLGGLGADQLKKFDPASASGFTSTQIGALSPDALKGMGQDLIKNLTSTAVSGMKDTQIASLLPDAIKGFTTDQIKNLAPAAVSGFNPTQVAQMQPSQLGAMQPEQFNKLGSGAVGAVTPEQFKALSASVVGGMDSTRLAALDVNVIKTLDKDTLSKLNSAEVKKLDGKELSEMLVNLNKQTVAPTDIKALLPAGWTVDDKTGKVQAPAGTQLTLPNVSNTTPTAGVDMPKMPDLTKGLALGGDSSGGSIIDGMKKALDNAGLTGFNMAQDKGVLNITGTGSKSGTRLAFIPDGNEIKQAPAGTASGLSMDTEGKYVLTTPEGMQVPVIPALASPDKVQKVSPGATVQVDAEGGTKITQSGKSPIVGIPDPVLKPSSQAPGIYRQGTGASEQMTVVYDDGTSQTLKPTIQDPNEFREATKAFPQIKEVTIGADGIIKIDYNGQTLQLRPDFDVEPATGSGTTTGTPKITPVNATTFRFTNSKGESQEFYLGGA